MTPRVAGLLALLIAGAGLGVAASQRDPGREAASLSPAKRLIGRAAQTADRALAQAAGADELDEAAFGDALVRDGGRTPWPGPEQGRVDSLVADLTARRAKPFAYRAFVEAGDAVNAYALPGGVLVVTTGLVAAMPDDAALACVLAHEVGHVELSHALDAARGEVRRGGRARGPVEVAAALRLALLRGVYSQAAEEEADGYALDALVASRWDPLGCARAFDALERANGAGGGLVPDLVSSHPPTRDRAARARARGEAWWAAHPDARRARWWAEVAP